MAHYCSKDCQKQHWKLGDHREQCPRLREVCMSMSSARCPFIVSHPANSAVSPYRPLDSIDLSVLYQICNLAQEYFQTHWDFCKKDGYDKISVNLVDLDKGHDRLENLATYERFKKHDLSHWEELVRRRAPKGDAPSIWITAHGWPLEVTTLEKVREMRVEVQYFGVKKYGS